MAASLLEPSLILLSIVLLLSDAVAFNRDRLEPLDGSSFSCDDKRANEAPGVGTSGLSRTVFLEVRSPPAHQDWSIKIVGVHPELELGPKAGFAGMIDHRTLNIPLGEDARPKFLCLGAKLEIVAVAEANRPSSQETIFDPEWPKSFSELSAGDVEKLERFSSALGYISSLDTDGQLDRANCNAVRIARKYWITNLHCLTEKSYKYYKDNPAGYLLIRRKPDEAVRVKPVFKGAILLSERELDQAIAQGLYATWAKKGTASQSRDFMLLKALDPQPPSHVASIAVGARHGASPNPSSFLLQWWHDGAGYKEVKVDRGTCCQNIIQSQPQDQWLQDCPAPFIGHQCSTQPTSSGSALFASDGTFIALHFLGASLNESGSFCRSENARPRSRNCALPAHEILESLRQAGEFQIISDLEDVDGG